MKLYTINTPCWTDYDSQNTRGESLIENKLSDHFTFMNYNFMKYGLVDEVFIFLDKKRIDRGILEKTLETEYGNMHVFDKREIPNMNLEEKQFTYCWSGWDETSQLGDNFVIVNPMFSGITYPSKITEKKHDYALIEGSAFKNTVPKGMPFDVFHYTSYDFCNIRDSEKNGSNREYDWILVSSFDPRKRHLEFIESVIKNNATKSMKGCIVGRNPDNKGYVNDAHRVLKGVRSLVENYKLDVDIFLNASQDTKKNLMLNSKVYVCPSSLDNGPRSMIEAGQAGCILLSLPHIGSSSVIQKNVTGEIARDVESMPKILEKIIIEHDTYDKLGVSKQVSPENVFPRLIQKIRRLYDDRFEQ